MKQKTKTIIIIILGSTIAGFLCYFLWVIDIIKILFNI